MFSSSSLRNQEARWQNSVNSSNPEPDQNWWESRQPAVQLTVNINFLDDFIEPLISKFKVPNQSSSFSLFITRLADLRQRHRADLGGIFPVGKLKICFSFLQIKFYFDLPSHHAQYRADSICGDDPGTVWESIKTLLQNHHLSRVQVVSYLMKRKIV